MEKQVQKLSSLQQSLDEINKEIWSIKTEMLKQLVTPLGGSKTYNIGKYKVTAKRSLVYTLNGDQWLDIKKNIPKRFQPVDTVIKLNVGKLKSLATSNPVYYDRIMEAVTLKPTKEALVIR